MTPTIGQPIAGSLADSSSIDDRLGIGGGATLAPYAAAPAPTAGAAAMAPAPGPLRMPSFPAPPALPPMEPLRAWMAVAWPPACPGASSWDTPPARGAPLPFGSMLIGVTFPVRLDWVNDEDFVAPLPPTASSAPSSG